MYFLGLGILELGIANREFGGKEAKFYTYSLAGKLLSFSWLYIILGRMG